MINEQFNVKSDIKVEKQQEVQRYHNVTFGGDIISGL